MPNYNIGEFIKYRRIKLGVSQTELCRGICNVGTISRIENGEHLPRNEVLERILQRLGYSGKVLDGFLTQKDFKTAQIIQQAKNLYSFGKTNEAMALINSLNGNCEGLRIQDRQFCDRLETVYLNSKGAITTEQALKRFIGILERSTGRLDFNNLPMIVSFEEMHILNNIAVCYARTGRIDTAIKILYHTKRICDRNIFDYYESMKSLPEILYNLSKCLGLNGRYDESIFICEHSIETSKMTGWLRFLPQTMHVLGWSLIKRGRTGDKEHARKVLEDVYDLSMMLSGNSGRTRRISWLMSESVRQQ